MNDINLEQEKQETTKFIFDFIYRIAMHHAMWFFETKHQFGEKKALEILNNVYEKSMPIQIKRLSKVLNFEIDKNNLPILNLDQSKLEELKESLAINWLANDGIWFQSIEFSRNMFDAKRCNDSCWGQFSPFEAWSIKRLLKLEKNCGLEGLKKALNSRIYATINKQSIIDDGKNSFIFEMNECRVQVARKRKGLEDYPCKSGGMIEYLSFAEAIDERIKTECIGCPPDKHPDNWYCAWRFYIS